MASASNTLDQVRSIRYDFDASFLTKQTIGTTLHFTVGDKEVRTWGAWVGGDGAVHVQQEGYGTGSVYAQMSFMGACWPQPSP